MSRRAWWAEAGALTALAVLLGACDSERTPSSTLAIADNSCLYEAPPTPTPSLATPTPTGTPTPRPTNTPTNVTPVPTPTPTPGPTVVLGAMGMPDGVEAWANAIVAVHEPTGSGGTHQQTGLVVREDGRVLTVFALPPRDGLEVTVGGRTLPAAVDAYDPLTGAVLLKIEAIGLVVAPVAEARSVSSTGERIVTISGRFREPGGRFSVSGAEATPDQLSPDDLFALMVDSKNSGLELGSVIVGLDGSVLGLAGTARQWLGHTFVSGGPGVIVRPYAAVRIGSAMRLLDGERDGVATTPGALAYHGDGWARFADNPVSRASVASPVAEVLTNLDRPAEVDWLGGRPRPIGSSVPGTVLELLYHEPQTLRDADGNVLGEARYIALWWRRGGDQPDVVLCGRDEDHVGAAFETWGLGRFEALMDGQPSTGRAIVNPVEPAPNRETSRSLYEAYASDPEQADLRFRFATVETFGTVVSVTSGQGRTTLRLEGGSGGGVLCSYHTPELERPVQVDERVSVRGVILGLATSGDVLMDRCEFVGPILVRLAEDEIGLGPLDWELPDYIGPPIPSGASR